MESAALATATIVPGSALGLNGAVAPSERIGFGVIGLGDRGSANSSALLDIRETQINAVCDVYRDKAEGRRKRIDDHYAQALGDKATYNGCAAYQDFRELLARDDIDAVVVTAPENWHALMGIHAARAGKDIYGEKALTLTVAEGRALCRAIRRHKRVFQTGTQQRSAGNFRHACELARNGYLGDLHTVKVGVPGGRSLPVGTPAPVPENLDYDLWLGPARWTPYNDVKCTYNWYFMRDYCAGWIQSWGVHHVDIALWGAPALGRGMLEVEGTATFPTEGMANTSITWDVTCTTESGLRLRFTDNATNPQGCRFEGSEGWVHVNRGGINAEPRSLLSAVIRPDEEHLYESSHHMRDFVECIRSRRDPASPVEAGHAATTLTLVSDIATIARRKLRWDWAAERFHDDPVGNRMLGRPMRSPWTL